MVQAFISQTLLGKAGTDRCQRFSILAISDPSGTQFRQPVVNIQFSLWVTIGTGGVIDRDGLIIFIAWFVLLPPICVGLSWISRIGT